MITKKITALGMLGIQLKILVSMRANAVYLLNLGFHRHGYKRLLTI